MTDNNRGNDIEFDFSKIKKIFTAKRIQVLTLLLLILIPVTLTIYIRAQPWNMPATDVWAENSVYNYYKNNIAQQINSQYPNLPSTQKQKLIDEQFLQFEKANKEQLTQQIQQTSNYFKSGFQYQENENTYTFLGDLDSYYFLRFVENLNERGTVCDLVIGDMCRDTHQYAPLGSDMGSAFMHPLGIFYTYKFLHFFKPSINPMQAAFILPTILAVIAVIAAFFIGRRIMNSTAGFFAAMLVATSPLLITRTLGSDTDIWNILFPLIIIWIFLEAVEAKNLYVKIGLTAITGLFMGLFSFAWGGWWYIFVFLFLAVVAHLIFEIVKSKIQKVSFKHTIVKLKPEIYVIAVLFISSMIFVSLFASFNIFIRAFTNPVQISSSLKIAANENLWPNVYTTVAELNEASIPTIVGQTSFGMNILFALALLGIIFTLVKKTPDIKDYILIGVSSVIYIFLISTRAMSMNPFLYLFIMMVPVIVAVIMLLREKDNVIDVKMAFLLTIWFVGMIYASQKGIRFILLLTPVFAIALGVAIGYIHQYFKRVFNKSLDINEKISSVTAFILLCLILIMPVQIGISSGESYMPSMTKGWWDSLTKIREESRPDAIINSWWDFGHWFKYVADRRVTLDGSGQNHPAAHWLGLILQTNNEKQSVAILRMLDCGSNNAFVEVDKKYSDTEISENIVSELIMLDKDDAQKYLKNLGYTDTEIKTILNYTHCEPPEDYFITSEDMVGKAGVWAHFGLWNFDKAYIINNVRGKSADEGIKLMKDRWNYTDEQASKIYYDVQALQTDREMNDWISPWPSYAGGMTSCSNVNEMVVCVLNIGIGSNGQQNVILERAIINTTNPKDSVFRVLYQDITSGSLVGENFAGMQEVVISNNKLTKYSVNNASIGLSVLLDISEENNQTQYRSIVSDPLLIDSTFTKLFYLDGKHTEHFEKFSDVTDITGSRIIVWKVRW